MSERADRDDAPSVYSDAVLDHATRPRNVGTLDLADGVGSDGNPLYGNQVRIYLRLVRDHVAEARFKAFGCSATIAAASVATELAQGSSLTTVRALDAGAIEAALAGLPAEKRHCARVAANALQRAVAACPMGPATDER